MVSDSKISYLCSEIMYADSTSCKYMMEKRNFLNTKLNLNKS